MALSRIEAFWLFVTIGSGLVTLTAAFA